MIVIGIDPSLTGTGIAVLDTDARTFTTETISPGKLKGHERLDFILRRVRAVADDPAHFGAAVAIEEPAYGAKGREYHQLAGCWHLIDHELWKLGHKAAVINGSTVKIYATGKHDTNKEQLMMQIGRRFPTFEGDNNAADALVVGCALADRLGLPFVSMPATHRRALKAIELPERLADLAPALDL